MKAWMVIFLLTLPIFAEKKTVGELKLTQVHDKQNLRIDLTWISKGVEYRYDVYRLHDDGTREAIFLNWREPVDYEMRVWYFYGHRVGSRIHMFDKEVILQVKETYFE